MTNTQRVACHLWLIIIQRCNYECPAVQDAIDRLAGTLTDGRACLIKNLFETKAGRWDGDWFINWFMITAKAKDIEIVTGKDKDYWYAMLR